MEKPLKTFQLFVTHLRPIIRFHTEIKSISKRIIRLKVSKTRCEKLVLVGLRVPDNKTLQNLAGQMDMTPELSQPAERIGA